MFAAYAVTEGILAPNWRFGSFRVWLLPGLAVASVVALVAGTVLEKRELGGAERRRTGRSIAGVLLASLYSVVVIGGVLLLVVVSESDPDIGYPASSEVLPLGPGLTVEQHQMGCGTGDYATCTTDFQVTYPSGLSPDVALQRVVSQLTRVHGWRLSPAGSLSDCRHIGGQDVDIQVIPAGSGLITIELGGGPPMDSGSC